MLLFTLCVCCPTRAMASPFLRYLAHTQRRMAVGRSPLVKWPAHTQRRMAVGRSPLVEWPAHTQRRMTFGRSPLVERPARHRHLHITKHSTHNRQLPIASAGFEPAIPPSKRPQTYDLDRTATGSLQYTVYIYIYIYIGFKTFFYVVRHLYSIASYFSTGLHLCFFRSWPSLYLPSSFLRSSSCSLLFRHPLQCHFG